MPTRADVEARMADILNRDDFAARITVWFDRAYTSLQRRFDFLAMSVTETMAIVAGMSEFPAPQDLKKSRLLYLWDPVNHQIVTRYRETILEEVRGYLGTVCDDGEFGGVFTNCYNTLIFSPTMTTQQVGMYLRYDYFRFMTPADNDWILTRAEDFIVYRGLAESAPFLAADPRLGTWAALAKEAYEELWKFDLNQQVSGPMQLRG
jgi:hypothetical protein